MAFASRFTVFNPETNITATCTEVEPGNYRAVWFQNGKEHVLVCTEDSIREEMNQGHLVDYKVVPWLH